MAEARGGTDEGGAVGLVDVGHRPTDARVKYVRAGRTARRAAAPAVEDAETIPERGRGGDGGSVHVVNRPARLPTSPLWPMELRADLTAGALDFETTRALCKAIKAGEAPPPTSMRRTGKRAEPVWSLEVVNTFIARRHGDYAG